MTESHIIADTMRLLRNLSDERLRILEAWTIEMRVNEPGHPAGLWLNTSARISRGPKIHHPRTRGAFAIPRAVIYHTMHHSV